MSTPITWLRYRHGRSQQVYDQNLPSELFVLYRVCNQSGLLLHKSAQTAFIVDKVDDGAAVFLCGDRVFGVDYIGAAQDTLVLEGKETGLQTSGHEALRPGLHHRSLDLCHYSHLEDFRGDFQLRRGCLAK